LNQDAGEGSVELTLDQLRDWGRDLGFSQIGVADAGGQGDARSQALWAQAQAGLEAWLRAGFHGDMTYMARHGSKRAQPAQLLPGTRRVVTARMDYLPRASPEDWQAIEWQGLRQMQQASISLYARGRDYHRVLRQRLQRLALRMQALAGPHGHRVFTDSGPVLEVELAQRSGLGWRGKHTLALHRDGGSMFFLGEIFTTLPLPLTDAVSAHCGSCSACLDICPTQAIVAPYRLDARRCISYLTIESDAPIPVPLRRSIGNRIYGCDDCQLVCPWNRYAQRSSLPDFDVRDRFARGQTLLALWAWTEGEFLHQTEGSAIRRIGYLRWRRNLAVALGNRLADGECAATRGALSQALPQAAPLVAEHIAWALAQGLPAGGDAQALTAAD
jgi:epoxyqueuosine reductase